MASNATRKQVLKLYKSLMSESKKFPSYNFRLDFVFFYVTVIVVLSSSQRFCVTEIMLYVELGTHLNKIRV